MPRVMFLLFVFFCIFILTGCNEPTLKTTSEESYKETLKSIYESQKSEEKRMEIAKSLLFVATHGSEVLIGHDSSKAYDLYQVLGFTGNQGRLMALDGKTADDIVKTGHEARKKWVLDNLPGTIAKYKKRIGELEAKKEEVTKIEQTHKAASIANVVLNTKEMLAHGTGKPMGFVDTFIVNFDAINDGPLAIYDYTISLEIKDSEKTSAKPVRHGTIEIGFNPPVAPGTTGKATKEINVGAYSLPYGINRYVMSAALKSVRTTPDIFVPESRFTEYNKKELAELRKKLAAAETELQAY